MKILTPYLFRLLDYADYQNLNKSELLSNQDIDINSEEEMISAEKYLSIFSKVVESTKNDYSGLNFGRYLNLDALGLVLEISLNTSSFEHGLVILENFLNSKFPVVTVKLIEGADNYFLQLDCSVKDENLKRNLLDMVLCIVYREIKLMLPSDFGVAVQLPYADIKPYYDFFKEGLSHHADYQIVLPLEVMKLEINKNKVKEIELLLPKFISMLKESKKSDDNFSSQIRSITLNMCAPEIPNFEQVQKQFFYSKRTIQRKLTNEGMSFRKITNNIKSELAYYLSYEKHLKTKDIAYILGYSEASAYLHALKEWRKNDPLFLSK